MISVSDIMWQHPWLAADAGILAAGATAVWYGVLYSGSQMLAPVTRRIQQPHAVALTFDDGPTAGFTDRVLDILQDHHAHASFFLIGSQARQEPNLVKRMIAEGHTVGNHTWNHDHHGVWHGEAYWRDQLLRTSAALTDITGLAPALFRAPMGFKTPPQARAVRQQSMRYIAWRVRAWDTLNMSPRTICRIITAQIRPGDIVTMHDGLEPARRHCSQESTVRALPQILKFLGDHGLQSISLEQGLSVPAYQL
ncbi:MAG: polysaccharide deacetylase family protein [Phycisphaerae bacterium]